MGVLPPPPWPPCHATTPVLGKYEHRREAKQFRFRRGLFKLSDIAMCSSRPVAVASSRARLAALMAVSCVAGATDSVMSPYLCPLVRARAGAGASLCGLMISARFATHIVFVLVLGQAVARLGAARMLVTSALLCGLANMLLASVELVTPAVMTVSSDQDAR